MISPKHVLCYSTAWNKIKRNYAMTEDQLYTCRNNPRLIGHDDAEASMLSRVKHGTIPHAWLISGVKGIGKATLAYRFARFLLNNDAGGLFGMPDTMDMDPEHPVFRKVVLGSHPDLLVLERGVDPKTGKVARDIVVDDARRIGSFLRLTAAESDHRVVIVDSVDEMNSNAANSILKLLEEPPAGAILILVSHTPGKILPTIKSRCCHIKLQPLSEDNVSKVVFAMHPEISSSELQLLQQFAKGTPGIALELYREKVMHLYNNILHVMTQLPSMDAVEVHKLGDSLAAKSSVPVWQYGNFLLQHCLSMLIKAGVSPSVRSSYAEDEQRMIDSLLSYKPIKHWFAIWDKLQEMHQDVERLNADPKLATLQLFAAMKGTVA